MTAIKDDYYHVGLTDEQVRKSRDEHGNCIWRSLRTP